MKTKPSLKGVKLSENVKATANLADMAGNDYIFMVVPAQFVRPVLNELKSHISDSAAIVLCAKGIEQTTGKLMTEVVSEVLPKSPLVVLSGPTFAREVANGLPSAGNHRVKIPAGYPKAFGCDWSANF